MLLKINIIRMCFSDDTPQRPQPPPSPSPSPPKAPPLEPEEPPEEQKMRSGPSLIQYEVEEVVEDHLKWAWISRDEIISACAVVGDDELEQLGLLHCFALEFPRPNVSVPHN